MTFPWENIDEPTCPHGVPLHQDCFRCVAGTVRLLQEDMLFAVKHTAVMVRSTNPALCLVVNTGRGPNIPAGKACFTDGTEVEMVDIGMPQPGIPLMTAAELAKLLFHKANELGLELT
jgi:hypothetical protein